jgi:hypothetical protein
MGRMSKTARLKFSAEEIEVLDDILAERNALAGNALADLVRATIAQRICAKVRQAKTMLGELGPQSGGLLVQDDDTVVKSNP